MYVIACREKEVYFWKITKTLKWHSMLWCMVVIGVTFLNSHYNDYAKEKIYSAGQYNRTNYNNHFGFHAVN